MCVRTRYNTAAAKEGTIEFSCGGVWEIEGVEDGHQFTVNGEGNKK
jgi:hypothetical protein